MSELSNWGLLPAALFILGVIGIIQSRNLWVAMLSTELLYLGVISSWAYVSDLATALYALLLVVMAASESAIGLGLLVVLFRFGGTIQFEAYQNLRR